MALSSTKPDNTDAIFGRDEMMTCKIAELDTNIMKLGHGIHNLLANRSHREHVKYAGRLVETNPQML